MNCRDVRDVADSFLSEELLTETNHEILRHLEGCPSCRSEIDGRRRLRGALRTAFDRAPELQLRTAFGDQLRGQLREAAGRRRPASSFTRRWFALAAGLVIVTGVVGDLIVIRSKMPAGALAADAIGDHRNCALKFRLVRRPVPLEDAAQRFDSAYRLLLDAPPENVSMPDGSARVLERHSCAYGARRFGHVIMQYKGRVVSLLMTANDGVTGSADVVDGGPHLIGQPADGLSVVSVSGSRHAILLVSDLGSDELTELSRTVALPLAQRVASLGPGKTTTPALVIAVGAHLRSASRLP